jgi:hypothetical protein
MERPEASPVGRGEGAGRGMLPVPFGSDRMTRGLPVRELTPSAGSLCSEFPVPGSLDMTAQGERGDRTRWAR